MTKDLPSQTKMEASSEGNFSVSMNTSSNAPLQEEWPGLGLYPGDVHVKIQMGMPVQFLGFEIWANPVFFSGGVSKTGAISLGYVKVRPQEHFFTHDCNVTFRNDCVTIARKICNTATPVHGAIAKFADR